MYYAKHAETGEDCAVKVIHDEYITAHDVEAVMQEVHVLNAFSHPHIARMIEYDPQGVLKTDKGATKTVFFIAMELCAGGELFDLIVETGGFSEKIARYFFQQICSALEYMQEFGVSHRDLKSENIMLNDGKIL